MTARLFSHHRHRSTDSEHADTAKFCHRRLSDSLRSSPVSDVGSYSYSLEERSVRFCLQELDVHG